MSQLADKHGMKIGTAIGMLLVLGLLAFSCSQGPGITGASGPSAKGEGTKDGGGGKGGSGGDLGTESVDGGGGGGDDEFDPAGGEDGGEAAIAYPTFRFNGRGNSICGEMNHVTTINVTTEYTETEMIVTKSNSRVYCEIEISGSDDIPDDKCNEIANSAQNLDKRNQTTTYVRLKGDELTKANEEGLDSKPWAMFSKEIKISSGRVITLSKPLPVGVVPAPAGRYKGMETQTWNATANDGRLTFEVNVTFTKVSLDDDTAKIKVDSVIPTGFADHTIYESWPMPASATYTVDTKTQSITLIEAQGKNGDGGEERCSKRDTSTTTLTLCDKIQGGETKAFGCAFGTNALK